MDPERIVVLAALGAELSPVRSALEHERWLRFVRTGVGPARARRAAHEAPSDAALWIVTGCCGGLVPALPSGTLAIPDEVRTLDRSGRAATAPPPDPELAARARAAADRLGLASSAGPLVTVERALFTPQSKRACAERLGAVAVDMETAAIAHVAAARSIPYVVMRVVLDSADETLPDVSIADDEQGPGAVRLLAALGRPRALLSLAALALRLHRLMPKVGRAVAAFVEVAQNRTTARTSAPEKAG